LWRRQLQGLREAWRYRPESTAKKLIAVLALAVGCVCVGLMCVTLGDLVAARPLFFVAIPLLIALGFTFLLNPKALVAAIILVRAGADQIFQNTGFGSASGLGGAVNLLVILVAFSFVVRDPKRVPWQAWWAWLPFLLLQAGGVLHSPDAFQQLRALLGQVSIFAMFIAAFYLVDDLPSMDKTLRLIVVSSIPVMALTVLYIARGDTASSFEGTETVVGRYAGPFPHPNILAFYTTLIIGLVLYILKRARNTPQIWTKLLAMGYLLLLLGVLYATKTRSAWIVTAMLFGIYGLLFERRYLVYLLVAPALAMLIPEFRDRVLDITQGNQVTQYAKLNSFAWRKLLWTTGLEWMTPAYYLTGYGAGAFREYSASFFPQSGGFNWDAHSVFVQLFFDIGLTGLLGYFWLYFSCFKMVRPVVKVDKLLAMIAGALLFAYLLISASDNMLAYLVYNWYFWLFIGAVCAMARNLPVTSQPSERARNF
jgi:putative inorganic carbon (hco3(-)) transporter